MLKFHPKKKEMLKWVKEMRFYNTNFHFIWFNFKYPELKKLRMQRSSPWFRWECLLSQWILLSLCWNGSTLSVPFSLSLSISIKNWHPLNTQIWDWSSQQEFPSTVIHSPESVYAWIKNKKKNSVIHYTPTTQKMKKNNIYTDFELGNSQRNAFTDLIVTHFTYIYFINSHFRLRFFNFSCLHARFHMH